jgi:hypothetical protein
MIHDKSKAAALILAKIAPKPDEPEESEGNGQGLEAAAEELIEAVERKDAAGVAEAMRHAFAICQSEPDELDEMDEPEDE